MIEKLARAANSELEMSDVYLSWNAAERIVRAILEALRDPSPEMLDETSYVAGLDESPRAAWQAMIDTILNERKG